MEAKVIHLRESFLGYFHQIHLIRTQVHTVFHYNKFYQSNRMYFPFVIKIENIKMENFVSLVVEELYGANPSIVARAMVGHDWMQLATI